MELLDGALQSEADRPISKRCKSPREALEAAEALVVPAEVATAAVADLMAAVGDATGGATSG